MAPSSLFAADPIRVVIPLMLRLHAWIMFIPQLGHACLSSKPSSMEGEQGDMKTQRITRRRGKRTNLEFQLMSMNLVTMSLSRVFPFDIDLAKIPRRAERFKRAFFIFFLSRR